MVIVSFLSREKEHYFVEEPPPDTRVLRRKERGIY
jgi:hypothetical protein